MPLQCQAGLKDSYTVSGRMKCRENVPLRSPAARNITNQWPLLLPFGQHVNMLAMGSSQLANEHGQRPNAGLFLQNTRTPIIGSFAWELPIGWNFLRTVLQSETPTTLFSLLSPCLHRFKTCIMDQSLSLPSLVISPEFLIDVSPSTSSPILTSASHKNWTNTSRAQSDSRKRQ